MGKVDFDEDGVRALLEPEDLWNRLLSLDWAKLKELLSDETAARYQT